MIWWYWLGNCIDMSRDSLLLKLILSPFVVAPAERSNWSFPTLSLSQWQSTALWLKYIKINLIRRTCPSNRYVHHAHFFPITSTLVHFQPFKWCICNHLSSSIASLGMITTAVERSGWNESQTWSWIWVVTCALATHFPLKTWLIKPKQLGWGLGWLVGSVGSDWVGWFGWVWFVLLRSQILLV